MVDLMAAGMEKHYWTKTRTNQQQDDELGHKTQHDGLWKRIMQKAKHGYGMGKLNPNFCFGFFVDYGTKDNKKTLELKIDVKPDSKPESLITK